MKIFLRKCVAGIYLLNLLALPVGSEPAAPGDTVASLNDVSINNGNLVLTMSQLMPYDVYTLDSPWRLVVEIPEVRYKAGFSRKAVSDPLISRVRGYQFKENPLIARVILDLKAPVDYKASAEGAVVTVALTKNEVLAEDKAPAKEKKSRRISTDSGPKTDLLRSLPREVVTLDFEGADIKDVIRLMAETSNINIIFGPEVNGTIAIHLKQVPFDEAFRTILNLKGLVATQLGANILRVTTPKILADERAKAVMFTKTVPINYLKATDVQAHIQSIMAAAGRKGNITVVSETNSLVITDSEEGIEQAEILISQLDKRPKQVLIESRIVELNLNNGFDMGVQWEYFKNKTNANGFDFLGTGAVNSPSAPTGARVPWAITGADGNILNSGANTPGNAGTGVNLAGPTAAAITFGFVKNNQVLSATLAALVSQSKAKILSAPKVVTVNGEQAKIEAVQDIPFRTSTVSGTGIVSNSFKTVSAGIILTVTPTINAENRVTLRIKPESSFPTQDSTEAGPIIRTRNAQTTVIVKDGDTLVIGGLIDDQDTRGVQKVPVLGDLPIIGAFFRSNTNRKIRNELLVFVTPRIIRD